MCASAGASATAAPDSTRHTYWSWMHFAKLRGLVRRLLSDGGWLDGGSERGTANWVGSNQPFFDTVPVVCLTASFAQDRSSVCQSVIRAKL